MNKNDSILQLRGMIIAFLLLMDIVVRSAVLHSGFSEYTASPAGLGCSETDNVKTYRQKCMQILYSSIIWALAVPFIDCAFTGLPNGPGEWGSLILFCFWISFYSLKRSLKNKGLFEPALSQKSEKNSSKTVSRFRSYGGRHFFETFV
ncbi:hypothetical protein [Bacillus swezeyi]|uniref:Uncharacterized protein n=1 Tax=Bacillus swezeyi TaxID=1925020 RepID=A0A5M8S281_9BACI|nr:hypothetical protein [Bacillus swezeyi]KAA6453536.1 hypothetical protein DX927_04925 [Bacillus swezeyi]KAA6475863.1 hypothetical protein DX928_07105 [Bacillus swezeyi]TYS38907.1 hypothetical protein FZC77_04795 [Bacillus swezeyi]